MFRKKYIKEEIPFLVNTFIENGHKRTFLEALVKDYNTKKQNSDNRNCTNMKKIQWVPNIGPKIRKEFKKVKKDIKEVIIYL